MEVTSKTIEQLLSGHQEFITRADVARKYYGNRNVIRDIGANIYRDPKTAEVNPLRLADNRISHDWHRLLVAQKIAYLLTYPPTFDIGSASANDMVLQTLGDDFSEISAALGVDASNCGVGWLHYWKDKKGAFRYHAVDPTQIVPVYSGKLSSELVGVLRCYTELNPETGKTEQFTEYWDDTKVRFFRREIAGNGTAYVTFSYPEIGEEMIHKMGAVPFIPFYNNEDHTSDLILYQDLIDAYDKVVSGFANDMEDVQEIIFVIKNYGGQDKSEFMQDLKMSKLIKVEGEGGVDTIRAEIPFEARGAFLDRTRKQIFVSGMGVDPDPQQFGTASGVALKYLYSLLELKAGLMETQFRKGYAQLVRAICRHHGMSEPAKITQTWTRNAIQNDLETAQIAQQSMGVISDKTILKNHPWVEDVEAEQKQIEKEAADSEKRQEQYGFPALNQPKPSEDDPDEQ